MSNWQIVRPILGFAVFVCIFHYSISFYFLPKSYRDFKTIRNHSKNKVASVLLEEGVFNTQADSLTVHINENAGENFFKGIFIYNLKDKLKPETITAEYGYIIPTEVGSQFILYNGTHQEKDDKTGHVSIATFHSYKFSTIQYQSEHVERKLDYNELYINQLFDDKNLTDTEKHINFVNGNQRLIWPLYTSILPLLAAATMLIGQFNRRNMWTKPVSASVLGLIFIVLSLVFNSLANKHIWFVGIMYANVIFAMILALKILNFYTKSKTL